MRGWQQLWRNQGSSNGWCITPKDIVEKVEQVTEDLILWQEALLQIHHEVSSEIKSNCGLARIYSVQTNG